MSKYLKISFAPVTDEESGILMAELSDYDYYAFEQLTEKLVAYIEKENFDEQTLKQLTSKPYQIKELVEENWNKQWEQDFQPVVLRDFVAVRASFQPAITGVVHEIVITPKMSFGTGHHPTTLMMMDLMSGLDFEGKSVIDFGTGTGVLAILAERLRASSVDAVDNDQWSIDNALENIIENDCKVVTVRKAEDVRDSAVSGIILANINLNVLKANAVNLGLKTGDGGVLLLSGFLNTDMPEIKSCYEREGFTLVEERQEGNWFAALFQKVNGSS